MSVEDVLPATVLNGQPKSPHEGHHEDEGEGSRSPDGEASENMGSYVASAAVDTADDEDRGTSEWMVARHYHLSRRVVLKCLEVLDNRDSPERPGMMYESTLRGMVGRFYKVFDAYASESKLQERRRQVEAIFHHLRRHTKRRRGLAAVQEGYVEYEMTRRVYDLFTVDLNWCERIFFTVDVGEQTAWLSKMCSFFLITMIFASTLVWMLSTLPSINEIPDGCVGTEPGDCEPQPGEIFKTIESVSIVIFTFEYFVRILTVHSVRFALLNDKFVMEVLTGGMSAQRKDPPKMIPTVARRGASFSNPTPRDRVGAAFPTKLDGKAMTTVKYVTQPANMVDLCAILPYWIESFAGDSGGSSGLFMVLRVLRLTRVFRVFKLGKYNEVFLLFSNVVTKSTPALSLMLFFISLGCALFGTLIWFMEAGDWYPQGHPELLALNITGRGAYLRRDGTIDDNLEETPFQSIVHSFWYVIVTVTTVGYGDMAPKTPLGKLFGAVTILNGVIVLAMPIGVVGANFSAEYYRVMEDKKRRLKLKQKQDQARKRELEQMQHTKVDGSGALQAGRTLGAEIQRIDGAQHKIIDEALSLEEGWQAILPAALHAQLSASLDRFLSCLLAMSISKDDAIFAKPVTSIARLTELDLLASQVHTCILSAISLDVRGFDLNTARECRQSWANFVEIVWSYALDLCRVESVVIPPELFEIKANLLQDLPSHLSMTSTRLQSVSNIDSAHSPPVSAKQSTFGQVDSLPGEVSGSDESPMAEQDARDSVIAPPRKVGDEPIPPPLPPP